MLTVIKGAGDLASGIALRLHHAGFSVAMTELPRPTVIRRTVSFAQAVTRGHCQVEDVTACLVSSVNDVLRTIRDGDIPVLVDPEAACVPILQPDILVDAILAKRNLGTAITDAPVVIAAGPGFTAGVDCHAVIETMRGHYLGRVLLTGSAQENTNIPGLIGGFAGERVLRAPADGIFHALHEIGDTVKAGEAAGTVDGVPMLCQIDGVLRGILADGTPVVKGMKSGDVDPRCSIDHCWCVSDKALAVGGGVLEAALQLSGILHAPD